MSMRRAFGWAAAISLVDAFFTLLHATGVGKTGDLWRSSACGGDAKIRPPRRPYHWKWERDPPC